MADGPVHPCSIVFDTDGLCFPNNQIGATTGRVIAGVGVADSLSGDTVLKLLFEMPQSLPTGTAKLRIIGIAEGTGNAKINPAWKGLATGEDFDPASLNVETVQTLTIATAGVGTELKVTLDADVDGVNADEYIYMEVTFETSSWTLAVVSTFLFSIIWE